MEMHDAVKLLSLFFLQSIILKHIKPNGAFQAKWVKLSLARVGKKLNEYLIEILVHIIVRCTLHIVNREPESKHCSTLRV